MAYRSFSLSGFEARGVRKVIYIMVTLKGAMKSCQPLVLLASAGKATPSNCRDILLSHRYRLIMETLFGTTAKVVGMVKILWIGTIGSQALSGPRDGPIRVQFTD